MITSHFLFFYREKGKKTNFCCCCLFELQEWHNFLYFFLVKVCGIHTQILICHFWLCGKRFYWNINQMLPSSTSIKFVVVIKFSYCRLAFLSSQHMREGIQLSHSKARSGQWGAWEHSTCGQSQEVQVVNKAHSLWEGLPAAVTCHHQGSRSFNMTRGTTEKGILVSRHCKANMRKAAQPPHGCKTPSPSAPRSSSTHLHWVETLKESHLIKQFVTSKGFILTNHKNYQYCGTWWRLMSSSQPAFLKNLGNLSLDTLLFSISVP